MVSKTESTQKPYAVLGAGELVSHLHRRQDELEVWRYEFNLFRFDGNARATHALRPTDLRDIVKACQILAFTIADDGWICDDLRMELFELVNELDKVTQRWSRKHHGP